MTEQITLKPGIPIPRNRVTRRWHFKEMEIGDSFEVPKGKRAIVAAHASHIKKATGLVFSIRWVVNKETGKRELRCWRLK